MKVLISATPFAQSNKKPLSLLEKNNLKYEIKNLENIPEELFKKYIQNVDILIAGLEKLNKKNINFAKKLKFISRVGIGLDNIDINHTLKKNIKISYTPDAVTHSVAEFTFSLSHNLNRKICLSNLEMHNGNWHRHYGKKFVDLKIGVIGYGRIGKEFVNKLHKYGVKKIFVNDIKKINKKKFFQNVSKNFIYKNCNIISFHIPLNKANKNLVNINHFKSMKQKPIIINTSRGGIINENDIYLALKQELIESAALDVFIKEPYYGKLKNINNCLLTSHMGAMSKETREMMELQAVEEVIRFVEKKKLKREINYLHEKQ